MFDSVSHMIFICLIVVGWRVVWISVLAYTCVRAWRVFSAVETKTIALLKECFWVFVVFQAELQRKLVEFDMSMCVSMWERVNGFVVWFLSQVQRRGRKSETRWKPLEIELFDCCCYCCCCCCITLSVTEQ